MASALPAVAERRREPIEFTLRAHVTNNEDGVNVKACETGLSVHMTVRPPISKKPS